MYVGLRVRREISSNVINISNNPNIKFNENPVAYLRMSFARSLAILMIVSFIRIMVVVVVVVVVVVLIIIIIIIIKHTKYLS